MIGQDKMEKEIEEAVNAGFPRAVAFIGEKGCGKHSLSEELSNKLGTVIRDSTGDLDSSLLFSAEQGTVSSPVMYRFDVSASSGIAPQKQNMLLKFMEDPFPGSYVVLLGTSEDDLIPAVRTRCRIFRFGQYDSATLAQFVPYGFQNREYAEKILKTPGNLLMTDYRSFAEAEEMADRLFDRKTKVPLPDLLQWSDHAFNYGTGSGKPESYIFARMVEDLLLKNIASSSEEWYNKLSLGTDYFRNDVLHANRSSEVYIVRRYMILLENIKEDMNDITEH